MLGPRDSMVPLINTRRVSAVPGRRLSWTACSASSQDHQNTPVSDLNVILQERDACGVGLIANMDNEPSHKILADCLTALGCMEHRGGCSADNDSGDGAGILCQIPWKLVSDSVGSFDQNCTGVGQVFLPVDEAERAQAKELIESVLGQEGSLKVVGWRSVPVDVSVVGEYALATMPHIEQIIVESNKGLSGSALEAELLLNRKLIESAVTAKPELVESTYFCSFSGETIVYKGMLRSVVVGTFYLDLQNEDFVTSFCIYHRRFSTNTTPKWPLAQPMRVLGHNGEINTVQGNLNWMASRESVFSSPVWDGREKDLLPICNGAMSDSANLDRTAELLVRSGRELDETLMLLVPEAFRNHPTLSRNYPEVEDFYKYYAGIQEAWDGPALLVFSDGKQIGARLDRNGLRPARYWETSDRTLYVASEVGVLGDVLTNAENVVSKGRLGPGMMITTDLGSGKFNVNSEIAKKVANERPYSEWVANQRELAKVNPLNKCQMSSGDCLALQSASGYSGEDITMVIESMAIEGKEPTFCMGDDSALAVLSERPHMVYDYFKQRFAQVTNPAIDPLREGLVLSLESHLGARGNILEPDGNTLPPVVLKNPVLMESELEEVAKDKDLSAVTLYTRFPAGGAPGALKESIQRLCQEAAEAVEGGSNLIILSDRPEEGSIDADSPAIPALVAVGAVHHHLIASGLRMKASIVSDTTQCFSTHHVACLIAYGASAVCPYLALESCRQWRDAPRTAKLMSSGKVPALTMEQVQVNFRRALNAGLKKILSKMGISLVSSYCGAQIMEIYGLGPDVVDLAFKGSVSRIGGLSLDELAQEVETFWRKGFPEKELTAVAKFGFYRPAAGLEYHSNNLEMSKLLHTAIGLGGSARDAEAYKIYKQHIDEAPVTTLRNMLDVVSDREPIPLEEVEDVAAIMERFCTGGMSLGAISRETHECIAVAMNRIGGKSNSGEGGEDVNRFSKINNVNGDGESETFPNLKGLENGDDARSAIKQVASGRFGVTPGFLMNAEQIEIKVAQGAKPGEGGQLPGQKVSPYIAGLRRSKPGVPLISPPPHHDIYSIEDLAQLIYDLHQVNEAAKVSVKLVGEVGIGTVASGVAKANADIIQVSGHDGGTGASPISSIKHAGGPWELGLAETHKTLVQNGLRDRVVLRADGGFKCGHDVIQAALLGSDEFGFGTIAMISTGCFMARICHTNNCPVGVASQREELRRRFPGTPSDLVNFFLHVAEEVRAELAEMGYKSLDDIVGKAHLMKQSSTALAKTSKLDLEYLTTPELSDEMTSTERRTQPTHQNGPMGPVLDDEILTPEVVSCIENSDSMDISTPIVNVHRSVGARIAGQIAKQYGDAGFGGNLNITFEGSAGQSFGAFNIGGMNLTLVGEANDYVGKGMCGGEIVIKPPPGTQYDTSRSTICGNTCLYGATGGRLLVNGRAGERFAVRNSFAEAVVEGTGDHCCEYMTGGTIVVLGPVGRNVGAGMTGGLTYILDEGETVLSKVNSEIVKCKRVTSPVGEKQLKDLITDHAEKTGSTKATEILANWDFYLKKFWQVVPPCEAGSPEVVSPQELANLETLLTFST